MGEGLVVLVMMGGAIAGVPLMWRVAKRSPRPQWQRILLFLLFYSLSLLGSTLIGVAFLPDSNWFIQALFLVTGLAFWWPAWRGQVMPVLQRWQGKAKAKPESEPDFDAYRFDYTKANGERDTRTVTFTSFSRYGGQLYLNGLDHKRQATRSFKISRMRGLLTNMETGEMLEGALLSAGLPETPPEFRD